MTNNIKIKSKRIDFTTRRQVTEIIKSVPNFPKLANEVTRL